MTRYTVVWLKSAQDELAEVWLNAVDRQAVTTAVHQIDTTLAEDAPAQGVELKEGLRAFFAPPLKVIFSIRDEDRVVEILCVRSL